MTWFAAVACVLFPAYFLIDINYFIRSAFTAIFAKTRKKIRFLDPSSIYGLVLTSDIDFLFTHMNNARFLRELDFARIDHGTRSGFMEEAMRRGGMILLSSSFIRYRLPLPVFSRYKIVTSVTWWDEKNVYLIHKVITLRDDIIRAIIYARASLLRVNVLEIVEKVSPGTERPESDEVPADYKKWMETLELSSQLMKANLAGVGAGVGVGDGDVKKALLQEENLKKIEDAEPLVNGNGAVLTCNSKLELYSSTEKMNLLNQD